MGKSGAVLDVNDGNFSGEILQSDIPALVDFWASWCGPCQVIAPVIEELAKEYEGRIKFARLNEEENPLTPRQYGVRGIPTLILFKNKEVINQVVGVVQKERLRQICDEGMAE
jgi:thioredoxin 1